MARCPPLPEARCPFVNGPYRRRVLAVDVHANYIGFAVIEAPQHLIAWGLVQFTKHDRATPSRAGFETPRMIARFHPDAVVLTMPRNLKLARDRILRVREAFTAAAVRAKVPVFEIGRLEYLASFKARTRYGAAVAMAERYPALAPRLHKPRKIWQSEGHYASVFDAVAAGTAFMILKRRRRVA